ERNLHGDLGERPPAANRSVADAIRDELLVWDDKPGVVTGPDERIREADVFDDAVLAAVRDPVAESNRLADRDQQAGDEVPESALRGKADDHAEHGARRKDAAGDRLNLRNDEQRREEA